MTLYTVAVKYVSKLIKEILITKTAAVLAVMAIKCYCIVVFNYWLTDMNIYKVNIFTGPGCSTGEVGE
jgi:hypothetical protein